MKASAQVIDLPSDWVILPKREQGTTRARDLSFIGMSTW